MAGSQDEKKTKTLQNLDEMWRWINSTYILVRDRQTGEKQIFKMNDGLKYMVGPLSRELYEVEKIFSSEEELATLKILYEKKEKEPL